MKSFLQGKKSLTDTPLRAPATVSVLRPKAGAASAAESHGPHVEVIKEGDKVVRLIVTCGCGERTEVDCLYSGQG